MIVSYPPIYFLNSVDTTVVISKSKYAIGGNDNACKTHYRLVWGSEKNCMRGSDMSK